MIELAAKIKSREFTCEQVVITYSLRTAKTGIEYRLLADVNFEDAIQEARQKDILLKEGNTELPPLFGVPIAIKDHLPIKGMRSTSGMAAHITPPKTYDCS